MSSDVGDLLEASIIGKQVENFISSDVGKYLIQCIEAEEKKGYDALKAVDAERPDMVRSAQNSVALAEYMRSWLLEAVDAGIRATMILEDREN